jgi:hypothetical protein
MTGPPKLFLASDSVYRLDRPPETISERVRRRQFEAQMLAREHIGELRRTLDDALALANTVSAGGEVYPAAVREFTGRLASYLEGQATTIDALVERAPEPRL